MTTLTQEYTLGEPQVSGPLTVFPIVGPEPRLEYRTFEEATGSGAFVKELPGGGSVGDLLVDNPTDLPLLVYEGEEVLGAQQNRVFDVSVLVAAGSQVIVPVSCVERGRWDHRRSLEKFRLAPHAADPGLRRAKRQSANRRSELGLEARADQTQVWSLVDDRLATHSVASTSAAINDLYDIRRRNLNEIAGAIAAQPRQIGAVAQAGQHLLALDLVSRPDAFARLLPRLAQGYALAALGDTFAEPRLAAAETLLGAALTSPRWALHGPGMGAGFRLSDYRLVGSGLESDAELVQLCAFPGADTEPEVIQSFDRS